MDGIPNNTMPLTAYCWQQRQESCCPPTYWLTSSSTASYCKTISPSIETTTSITCSTGILIKNRYIGMSYDDDDDYYDDDEICAVCLHISSSTINFSISSVAGFSILIHFSSRSVTTTTSILRVSSMFPITTCNTTHRQTCFRTIS